MCPLRDCREALSQFRNVVERENDRIDDESNDDESNDDDDEKITPRSKYNSGFLKPVKISAEMASFCGFDPNTLYTQIDLTKKICYYVTDNKLQVASDRRLIKMDDKLSALLGLKSGDITTYPRIQQRIKSHFVL